MVVLEDGNNPLCQLVSPPDNAYVRDNYWMISKESDMAGLGDMMGMMKQAKEMQAKMEEMQGSLDELDVVGTAGAGMVSVTLSGKGEMRKVAIDPSMLKAEEAEILEDLIVAAHNDAKTKMEAAV